MAVPAARGVTGRQASGVGCPARGAGAHAQCGAASPASRGVGRAHVARARRASNDASPRRAASHCSVSALPAGGEARVPAPAATHDVRCDWERGPAPARGTRRGVAGPTLALARGADPDLEAPQPRPRVPAHRPPSPPSGPRARAACSRRPRASARRAAHTLAHSALRGPPTQHPHTHHGAADPRRPAGRDEPAGARRAAGGHLVPVRVRHALHRRANGSFRHTRARRPPCRHAPRRSTLSSLPPRPPARCAAT